MKQITNLFGASIGLCLVFWSPDGNFAIGLDQLTLEIQTSLGLFFELHAYGFQFDFDL